MADSNINDGLKSVDSVNRKNTIEDLPPETRYLKIYNISTGGEASVYEAVDTKFGYDELGNANRPVIIRSPQSLPSIKNPEERAEAIELWKIEAQIQAQLSMKYPQIQRVYDYVEVGEPPVPWVILEKNNGKSLSEMLLETEKKGLSINEVIEIAKQLGTVIDEINSMGLIHKDIKPSNILHEKSTYKLIDFTGVLKTSGEETWHGTPLYGDPESILNEGHDNSDAYALAATLYELLAGERYLDIPPNTPPPTIMRAVIRQQPTPITKHNEFNLKAKEARINPKSVDDVFAKQLSKSSKDRYKNATEFTKALIHALTEQVGDDDYVLLPKYREKNK